VKIVGIFDHLGDPQRARGGAERTAVAHLRGLALESGHDCQILTPVPTHGRSRRQSLGLPMRTYRDVEELKSIITRARPAAIFSNLELVYDAANLGQAIGIPHFALLDSFECCEPTAAEKRVWGVAVDRRYLSAEKVRFALRTSTAVLACSRALAKRVRKRHGLRVAVLYPRFVEHEMLLGKRVGGSFITGVCGSQYKGARIFLELARRFPRERFLLAGVVQPDLLPMFAGRKNVTVAGVLSTRDLLRQSRMIVVPSQWEEPFGRIAVEAMANGIPILASWTGGLKEVTGATELSVREFRSTAAWARSLGRLLSSEATRQANARVGRKRAQRFLKSSTPQLDRLIRRSTVRRIPRAAERTTVAIVGSQTARTAFAVINARLADTIDRSRRVRVVRCEDAPAVGTGAVDCFIHHDFTTDFSSLPAPAHGRWVVMRPWDFGPYPHAWAAKIRNECDQLWVPSRWSRALAVRGGVPPNRVAVIPWGIDPSVFTPTGPRFALRTRKRFVFLFVGAPVYRKGLDVALDAYGRAFTRADDVCFVIKSNPDDVFYGGIGLLDRVAALRSRTDHPEVIVIDEFLSEARLAALYRACSAGVYPYRAEGFALPILEGMACGVPPIVPDFGACLDYCTRDASFRVPARRINLPVRGSFRFNTLGFREAVDEVDFCEMPVEQLAQEMRRVAALSRGVLQRISAAAVRVSHQRFTWHSTGEHIVRAVDRLLRRQVPLRIASARRLAARRRRQRAVAVDLLATRARTAPAYGE
jgi:glycosyltransferase involved in cell wall biosynthesis